MQRIEYFFGRGRSLLWTARNPARYFLLDTLKHFEIVVAAGDTSGQFRKLCHAGISIVIQDDFVASLNG